ncbi:MAG: adenylate kinase [Candidatus Omnitrophica bacterium]|nr:adenylate kinase [Candidatus Omnitrophota bacterium]MDD5671525.1 adenylate kinase [Candidatus Omnitrophota bacterium]
MNLIFLGPPGAGKGTHAKVLSEQLGMSHLATGDILRRNIRDKTELGLKAKDVIERGALVSDDLVNAMMLGEIDRISDSRGFLLDGYPRTLGQADALEKFLGEKNRRLDAVIDFDTSEKIVIERLSGRRICPKCNANYHVRNIPPRVEGVCDHCGEKLTQRKDDQPDTIRHRLTTYHRETAPLTEYYQKKGLLNRIHGDLGIKEIQAEMKALFERLKLAV